METLFVILGLLCGYLVYSKGMQDGIALQKGKTISVPNPIKAVKEHKKQKIEEVKEDESVQAIMNMMNFNGFPQKVGE